MLPVCWVLGLFFVFLSVSGVQAQQSQSGQQQDQQAPSGQQAQTDQQLPAEPKPKINADDDPNGQQSLHRVQPAGTNGQVPGRLTMRDRWGLYGRSMIGPGTILGPA